MNGSTVSSTSLSYDVLGRQGTVSGNGLQQTQSYNLHGWTESIQASSGGTGVFSETLRYAEALYATPLHTGTITEVVWQHGASTPSTYAFSYDGANRLTGCSRYSGNTLDNSWTERDIAYDANGNITAIKRYGSSSATPEDNLSLTYSGNTLSGVGSAVFSHDSSGNLVNDPLRGLTFSYNLLGNPSSVTNSLADEADYSYLADGTKARVLGEQNEDGFAYMGSMVFSYDDGDWVFDSTPFVGGRIRKSGSTYVADRYATDHLGSVRAVVRSGQVIERNDYYPYGGRHANSALTTDATNRWRFSGKEIHTTASVNLLDFGARMYDDRLCRWTTQDPMSEKYYGCSPYVYCAGEPVGYVDTDGKKLYFAKGSSEEFKKHFADAVKIMNAKGTSYNLAAIEASSELFYISQAGKHGNRFDAENKTIEWSPSIVAYDDETDIMRSPLTTLAHEAGHAAHYIKDADAYYTNAITTVNKYNCVEELITITTTEQYAARKHGELFGNQVTRFKHYSTLYPGEQPDFTKMTMEQILNYVIENNKLQGYVIISK